MAATITGKMLGVTGEVVVGSLDVALCGYGSQVPRATGIATLSRLTENTTITIESDGTFDFIVNGNDQIEPAGTYYTITVRDDNGDIAQVNAYQFLDNVTYDLNSIAPYDPSQPFPLPPAIVNQLEYVNINTAGNYVGDGGNYLSFQLNATQDGTIQIINGLPGNLYTFIIKQDSIGGHNLLWDPHFINATVVNPAQNGITVQTFVMSDNSILYPIGAGTWQ